MSDSGDWLDSETFYDLCQQYRHVNQHAYIGEEKTVAAFEELKAAIRENMVPKGEAMSKSETPLTVAALLRNHNYDNSAAVVEALESDHAAMREALEAVCDGFKADPGTSDLDNEQPITLWITLGQWRKARSVLAGLKVKA